MERWRAIPGYVGFYEVSNLGRVRSVERQCRCQRNGRPDWRTVPSKVIKADIVFGGYLRVPLCRLGVISRRKVHELVLTTFVGPRPEGMVACHFDGDVTNNRLGNLRWDTRSANEADKQRHGTYVQRGERNGNSRLTDEQVRAIRSSTKLQKDLAREYGVSKVWISFIKTGKVRR